MTPFDHKSPKTDNGKAKLCWSSEVLALRPKTVMLMLAGAWRSPSSPFPAWIHPRHMSHSDGTPPCRQEPGKTSRHLSRQWQSEATVMAWPLPILALPGLFPPWEIKLTLEWEDPSQLVLPEAILWCLKSTCWIRPLWLSFPHKDGRHGSLMNGINWGCCFKLNYFFARPRLGGSGFLEEKVLP